MGDGVSRIRSIHPEQWTDEAFVSLSFGARLLAIAIRNECDDKGVFEWKPLSIKMRLFPADAVDVAAMLAELVEADVCRSYELGGKKYGAVRNFQRYQRPKKPNDVHPLPPEMLSYVGSTEPVPHQCPTSGEKSPQMEDEEGEKKDTEAIASAADAALDEIFTKQVFDRAVAYLGKSGTTEARARQLVGKWRKESGDSAVFEAMSRASKEGVTDPVPWLIAALAPPPTIKFDMSKFGDSP